MWSSSDSVRVKGVNTVSFSFGSVNSVNPVDSVNSPSQLSQLGLTGQTWRGSGLAQIRFGSVRSDWSTSDVVRVNIGQTS
ncbi:hypothetical protein Hanom_Chr02g00147181 [Helianthus anomalus]